MNKHDSLSLYFLLFFNFSTMFYSTASIHICVICMFHASLFFPARRCFIFLHVFHIPHLNSIICVEAKIVLDAIAVPFFFLQQYACRDLPLSLSSCLCGVAFSMTIPVDVFLSKFLYTREVKENSIVVCSEVQSLDSMGRNFFFSLPQCSWNLDVVFQ